MGHIYVQSEEYADLADEVIGMHPELHWILDADVRIGFLKSMYQKHSKGRDVHAECVLVKDMYRTFCPYDFLIIFYELNNSGFTDEQLRILMYHELLHVDVNEKDGEARYAVSPHDVEDFRTVIEQYGIDWAGR